MSKLRPAAVLLASILLCGVALPRCVPADIASLDSARPRSVSTTTFANADDSTFSATLDTSAVRTVAASVLDWQLHHAGRYAVWGRTTEGDSVALVLHGDGTIVRRAVEGWERPRRAPTPESGVVPEWAALVTEKTSPDVTYDELPDVVREAVAQEFDGTPGDNLHTSTAYHPRGWVMGALYAGMAEWGTTAESERALAALRHLGESTSWRLGDRTYVADDHAVGQMYLALYEKTRRTTQLRDVQMQFDWILNHPPEQSLTWDAGIRRWTWADALFMSPPVWAHLAALTGEPRYLEYMNTEWWATTQHLYDESSHLFYRDDRFIGRRGSHGEKIFWSRGNGWVMAGLVRVLEHLPADYPDRARYVTLYREMAHRLIELQAEDGLWRSNLLDPAGTSDPEVSGSGFFCYALAWGLNRGLLDRSSARAAVENAWTGLVGTVHPNGRLGWVQPPGDRPAVVNEDEIAPYGVGAFLLAASEVYELAR